MNITTTIPEESIPAWQARVDQFNAGSGQPPVTIEGMCQIFRDEQTAKYIAAKLEADKLALASDPELMQLGFDVASAPPDKRADAMAAARAVLDS